MIHRLSFLTLALLMTSFVRAEDEKKEPIKASLSKITSVTVYSNTALITREVTAPEGAGLTEVIVSPMPPYTMQSSLNAEGNDNIRVLSVRFRSRAIAEDTREEVRKLDAQIKTLTTKQQTLDSELKSIGENLKLLDKLEGFTAKSLEHLTDKGQLDTDKIIALAKFVQEDRTKRTKEQLLVKQQGEDVTAQIAFTKRLLDEKAGGVVRTERDAVILIDKKQGAGTIRLNYLVSNASWRPQYKFRTSGKDKDAIAVEYQAAVEQKTGEDWGNTRLTLSTAQPLLNASPPDLKLLAIAVGPPGTGVAILPGDTKSSPGGGMPNPTAFQKDLEKLSKDLRGQAAGNYAQNKNEDAAKQTNDAAAIEQYCDLFISRDDLVRADRPLVNDGPSVAYALKNGPSGFTVGEFRLLLPSEGLNRAEFYFVQSTSGCNASVVGSERRFGHGNQDGQRPSFPPPSSLLSLSRLRDCPSSLRSHFLAVLASLGLRVVGDDGACPRAARVLSAAWGAACGGVLGTATLPVYPSLRALGDRRPPRSRCARGDTPVAHQLGRSMASHGTRRRTRSTAEAKADYYSPRSR